MRPCTASFSPAARASACSATRPRFSIREERSWTRRGAAARRRLARFSSRCAPIKPRDPARAPLPVDRGFGPGRRPHRRNTLRVRRRTPAPPGSCWRATCPSLATSALSATAAAGAIRAHCATAYISAHDGLPEPLCAIWEPTAAARHRRVRAAGGRLPAKIPDPNHAARLLDPQDRRALDNVNTPEEYSQALSCQLEDCSSPCNSKFSTSL